MPERTCQRCGSPLTGRRMRFCSDRCQQQSRPPCTVDECTTPQLAKKLCATHYMRLRPNRHPRRAVICAYCRRSYSTVRTAGRYCSERCRGLDQRRPVGVIVRWVRPFDYERIVRASLPKPAGLRRPLTAGQCPVCGAWFVTLHHGRTCSPACRASWRRRRRRSGWITEDERRAIYARDAWTCRLCGHALSRSEVPPHPLAATLDHVIPKAHGGSDDPTNLQAAHHLCNSAKRDLPASMFTVPAVVLAAAQTMITPGEGTPSGPRI